MNKLVLTLLALLPMVAPVEAGIFDQVKSFFGGDAKTETTTIKVLVVNDEPGIVLELKGKHQVFDPNTGALLSSRPGSKRRIVQATDEGLKWGDEFPGVFQLQVVPNDSSINAVVDGVEYPGTIYIYNVDGKVSIVEETGLEEFLTLQLGNKFQNDLPHEVFAAIVITARTDALYHTKHPKNEFYAIDGAQIGYRGLSGAKPIKGLSKALEVTENMIMTNRGKGAPFAPQWGVELAGQSATDHGTVAKITIEEATEMARRGENAKEILEKAFPNTQIALID